MGNYRKAINTGTDGVKVMGEVFFSVTFFKK